MVFDIFRSVKNFYMKKIIIALIVCIVSVSTYAQEFGKSLKVDPYSLDEFDHGYADLIIEHIEITPSLSNRRVPELMDLQQISLKEIDLTVDIRKEAFRDKRPLVLLNNDRRISPTHKIQFNRQKETSGISISVSGSGSNNSNNAGKIKNIAYKEATGGIFCQATGQYY